MPAPSPRRRTTADDDRRSAPCRVSSPAPLAPGRRGRRPSLGLDLTAQAKWSVDGAGPGRQASRACPPAHDRAPREGGGRPAPSAAARDPGRTRHPPHPAAPSSWLDAPAGPSPEPGRWGRQSSPVGWPVHWSSRAGPPVLAGQGAAAGRGRPAPPPARGTRYRQPRRGPALSFAGYAECRANAFAVAACAGSASRAGIPPAARCPDSRMGEMRVPSSDCRVDALSVRGLS